MDIALIFQVNALLNSNLSAKSTHHTNLQKLVLPKSPKLRNGFTKSEQHKHQ